MASQSWNNRRRYSALQVNPGRRLSSLVPDLVVRRLSTLGLVPRNDPTECLVEQGKTLCAQYMRSRTGGVGRKWRWNSTKWAGSRLVFPRLSHLGRELEHTRPRLYAAIGRYAERSTVVEVDPPDLLYSIGVELFAGDISWGKVISLMAVSGALAKSAANSGRTELMPTLLEAAAAAMRGPLVPWLEANGGWFGLVEHCQPIERMQTKSNHATANVLLATGSALIVLLFIILIIKYSF